MEELREALGACAEWHARSHVILSLRARAGAVQVVPSAGAVVSKREDGEPGVPERPGERRAGDVGEPGVPARPGERRAGEERRVAEEALRRAGEGVESRLDRVRAKATAALEESSRAEAQAPAATAKVLAASRAIVSQVSDAASWLIGFGAGGGAGAEEEESRAERTRSASFTRPAAAAGAGSRGRTMTVDEAPPRRGVGATPAASDGGLLERRTLQVLELQSQLQSATAALEAARADADRARRGLSSAAAVAPAVRALALARTVLVEMQVDALRFSQVLAASQRSQPSAARPDSRPPSPARRPSFDAPPRSLPRDAGDVLDEMDEAWSALIPWGRPVRAGDWVGAADRSDAPPAHAPTPTLREGLGESVLVATADMLRPPPVWSPPRPEATSPGSLVDDVGEQLNTMAIFAAADPLQDGHGSALSLSDILPVEHVSASQRHGGEELLQQPQLTAHQQQRSASNSHDGGDDNDDDDDDDNDSVPEGEAAWIQESDSQGGSEEPEEAPPS
jgi:hypothetical protein